MRAKLLACVSLPELVYRRFAITAGGNV